MNKIRNAVLWLAAVALLVGCAAGERAFKDGRVLIEQGQVEPGLMQLEQALRENPKNVEFRTYYVRHRDLYVAHLLGKAEAARAVRQYDEAEDIYRRVYRFDANNVRAAEGLDGTRMDRRHGELLAKARKSLKDGDLDAADAVTHQVLAENPRHADARALQQQIDEKQTAEKASGPSLNAAFRKPITLEFRDANLKSIFEVISRATNINFIFDRDVRPDLRSTIFVKNTTIEDVISLLMVTNQLDRRVLNDNTILIYPNTPAKAKDYQELVVRAFYLANADVKQTLNMVKTLVKTRDVFIDEKLNLLVMKDTPEAIRLAEKLISAQDRAEPEVVLEVEVMEVKRNRLLDLGIQWPTQFTALNLVNTSASTIQGGTTVVSTATQVNQAVTVDTLRNLTGAQIAISPNLQLNLKKEDGDAQILANPRIRVKNKEKAKIHIGEKVPVITTTTTANVGVSESVNYLDVGLKLDVEPLISLDNEVSIKVGLEVSNIVREIRSQSGSLTYQVGTRNAATVLRLKDGETQALAGLISDEDRQNATKVPGLGDLPLVGRLFSTHRDETSKTEIVLLITPRIVRNVVRPEMSAMEFASGTEAAIGSPSLKLRPAGAPPIAVGVAPIARTASPLAAPVGQPVVSLIAPPQAKAESEFTVAVNLASPVDVRSLSFDLVFDPERLEVLRAIEGAFMKQGGDATQFRPVSGGAGRYTVSIARATGGAKGAGSVAQLTFRALALDADSGGGGDGASMTIENVTVQDATGASVPAILPPEITLSVLPK